MNLKGYEGLTPPHAACKVCNLDVIKLLIELGAKVKDDYKYINPLHVAASESCLNVIKCFMETLGISLNDVYGGGNTPLHSVIAHCNGLLNLNEDRALKIMKYLVEVGKLDADAKNQDVKTPLRIAAMEAGKELMKILLKHSANSNAIDSSGMALIHYAALRCMPYRELTDISAVFANFEPCKLIELLVRLARI